MVYDFQLLTKAEVKAKLSDQDSIWYPVNNILTFKNRDEVDDYIDKNGWLSKDFTKQTIRKLYEVVFKEHLINYYLEKTQEIDMVLDIFIRTNSGGEPLSFSDLLMSITTANWKSDARKEIADVVNKVLEITPGFLINKDFVLKTCLVLFSENIKFQVRNFDQSNVKLFEENWDRIKKSILESFTLLSNLGFNNHSLRSKNAVIPIIYYVYHRGIENDINHPLKYVNDKRIIQKWLTMSLLKSVFSGQSDAVLSGIRKAIKTELSNTTHEFSFPLDRIKDEFKTNPTKNLSFEDGLIEGLLTVQKDSPDCFLILSLIYSHLNFGNQDYHQDHLHPASYFKGIKRESFETDDDFYFYSDPLNWNSIANLQLLNSILNETKGASYLKEWVDLYNIDKSNQLIPDVSLDISDFRNFISERKKLLVKHLKNMVI
jgi:hypothetical protein